MAVVEATVEAALMKTTIPAAAESAALESTVSPAYHRAGVTASTAPTSTREGDAGHGEAEQEDGQRRDDQGSMFHGGDPHRRQSSHTALAPALRRSVRRKGSTACS